MDYHVVGHVRNASHINALPYFYWYNLQRSKGTHWEPAPPYGNHAGSVSDIYLKRDQVRYNDFQRTSHVLRLRTQTIYKRRTTSSGDSYLLSDLALCR